MICALRNIMSIKTLYLPGFSHYLRGRGAKSEAEKVMKQAMTHDGLAHLVARFLPVEVFHQEGLRRRLFTPMVAFVAFLGQVMNRGSSCREAVRRVQAWFIAAGKEAPDDSTSAYCQARKRLTIGLLRKAHEKLCAWFDGQAEAQDLWRGHVVKVIDGTGFSMPDSAANRAVYPYAGGQEEEVGFPTGKLVGLFSLTTGHLVKFVQGAWKHHDIQFARQLVGWVQENEVLLGDRGFCGWGLMALLLRKKVHLVLRVSNSRKTTGTRMFWEKPSREDNWTQALWNELPEQLEVRLVRYRTSAPGYRSEQIVLATTLLDEQAYPDDAIIELYHRRWQVELNFRDIKTTLGLDVLRTQTPDLIEKEIAMQVIAYNIIRGFMLLAAHLDKKPLYRLSFKGTVDTLRQWTKLFGYTEPHVLKSRWEDILRAIASDQVPDRPDRHEPRVVRRRPKSFSLMTQPRAELRAIQVQG